MAVAPKVDAVAQVAKSGTNSVQATLSTAFANEIICVFTYCEGNSGAAPSITGISDTAGLTWAKRKQSNASSTGSAELWWALATGILSSDVITVTFGANFDDLSMVVAGISGCNTSAPWDTNASVPAVFSSTASGSTPSFTGISTNNALDMVLVSVGYLGTGGVPPVPSGYSVLGYQSNGGGSQFSYVGVGYQRETSTLSSATVTWGGTTPGKCECILDALAAAPPTPYTYYRLNIAKSDDTTQATTAIAEVELHATAGGSNIATGGTASASSTTGGNVAANAFDGNASTYWQSAALAAQLQYQLTSAQGVQEYKVTARNDASYAQVPGQWTFEGSNDGATWTILDYVADWSWTQGQAKIYTVGANFGMPNKATGGTRNQKGQGPAEQAGTNGPNVVQQGKAPTPGPHTVSGKVTVLNVATAGILVRCYAKSTGELLGQTTTAADGTFTINCGVNWNDVEVIAYDPTTYQALIFDQIVPG